MAEYEVADFQKEVIEASHDLPVLVDFWAPWCGPCKMLGPVIEELADENVGKFKLVKVNTEKNVQVATDYSISSIPNVKLFSGGKQIDEFMGFKPKEELQTWIDNALPTETGNQLENARQQLSDGNLTEAEALAKKALEANPDDSEARILLAEIILGTAPQAALDTLTPITSAYDCPDKAAGIKTLADFLVAPAPSAETSPGLGAAFSALQQRGFDEAMRQLIRTLESEPKENRDIAASLGKAMIQILGVRHPVIDQHFRSFSSQINC
jgi:putative thioredoxin